MLFIVGTPIGNLEDISFRAVKTLLTVQILLCEDARETGIFLRRVRELYAPLLEAELMNGELPKLISYHKDNEFQKLSEVLDLIESRKDTALISDAGMPLVSDPGSLLIREVVRESIPFTVIPGPSAVTTALLHSGYRSDQWMFLGFFPKKTSECVKMLREVAYMRTMHKDMIFVAFDSPHRINEHFELIKKEIPDMKITVTRELTKLYEEVIRDPQILPVLKGEITLVLQ